jgi:lipopolysaccharide transport protein LptA
MKTLLLLCSLFAAVAAWAEDAPAPAAATTNKLSAAADPANALRGLRGNLTIESRSSMFDLKSNQVVYLGEVCVVASNMVMRCDYLTSAMPARGGRIERVVARTNVVIDMTSDKGDKLRATGEQAVYSYSVVEGRTNEVIELTGNPLLDNPQGTMAGDIISYDLLTSQVHAVNQRMVVRQGLGTSTNTVPLRKLGTHAPPATNSPSP